MTTDVTDNVVANGTISSSNNNNNIQKESISLYSVMFCLINEYTVGKYITKFLLESRNAQLSSVLVVTGRALHDVAKKSAVIHEKRIVKST